MQKKKQEVFPEAVLCFTGQKVGLGPVDADLHLADMLKGINKEKVNRFITVVSPVTSPQERKYLEGIGSSNLNISFAINILATNEFIGLMGLHEIDYASGTATTGSVIVKPEHWQKGYGYDAKMLLLHFAFHRLNLRRINSSVIAFNDRSAGCLKKCGYKEEGIRKEMHYRDGKYWDQILFRVFRDEFEPLWESYSEGLEA